MDGVLKNDDMLNIVKRAIKIIDEKNEELYDFDTKLRQTILNINGNNHNHLKKVIKYLDGLNKKKHVKTIIKSDISMLSDDEEESNIQKIIYYIKEIGIYEANVTYDYHGDDFAKKYFRNKEDAVFNSAYYVEKLGEWRSELNLYENKVDTGAFDRLMETINKRK